MIREEVKRLMVESLNEKVISKEDFDLLSKFMNGEQLTNSEEKE